MNVFVLNYQLNVLFKTTGNPEKKLKAGRMATWCKGQLSCLKLTLIFKSLDVTLGIIYGGGRGTYTLTIKLQ